MILMTRRRRSAFTLAEIMVVIVIIVLLLALAVPAFNLIRGSRSVEGAENQIAAVLGRARADAIGLQKPFGVMFFIEPTQDRVAVAEVYATDYPTGGTREVYLDIVADSEYVIFAPGVMAQTLNNDSPGNNVNDRYIGYNTVDNSNVEVGGVILFGGDGQVISRTWGFRLTDSSGAQTRMAQLLNLPAGKTLVDYGPAAAPPTAALGFVLFDRESFKSTGNDGDPQVGAAAWTQAEAAEESWIDDNATPLLVNRYNGTLVRGE